ncbi:hypothetical protein [Ekhidna sp.]
MKKRDDFKDLRVNTKVGDINNLNISEISSHVIVQLNNLEHWMGEILAFYFKPQEREEFMDLLMHSSITPFGSKAKLLRSLAIIDNQDYSSLMQMANIRNGFAHSIYYEVNDEVDEKIYHSIKILNNKGSIEYKEIKEQLDLFMEKADYFLHWLPEICFKARDSGNVSSIARLKKE